MDPKIAPERPKRYPSNPKQDEPRTKTTKKQTNFKIKHHEKTSLPIVARYFFERFYVVANEQQNACYER